MTALLDVLKCAAVDEYGQLDSDLARLDAEHHYESRKRRKEALREVILGWHKDLPADEETIEHGVQYDIRITARDNQRVVSISGKKKLRKLWGAARFLEACAIILKLLPDPKDAAGLYTVNDRTGPRHLKPLAVLKQAA
jgi:hypothetical protein